MDDSKTQTIKRKSFVSDLKELLINILIPSMYLIPLAVAFFSPKNFGFGYPEIVWR